MDFQLKTLGLAQAASEKGDALVVLVHDDFKGEGSDGVSRLLAQARKAGDLKGKPGKLVEAYGAADVSAMRLLLCSAGDLSSTAVRSAVGAALQAVKSAAPKKLAMVFAGAVDARALHAAMLAAADASYVYTTTKSKPEPRTIRQLVLGVADASGLQAGFDVARATVRGIEFAKEWANRPGNHSTPTMLAEAAQSLARGPKLKVEVLGPREVAKLGMGAFMAVAQGSEQPLRFIVLRYQGAAKDVAPQVLVGKGITFDTGGVSLKPAAEMDEMKFDMGGAASVLGTFRALGQLKPKLNVVGLVATCENMPDGGAYKPGDILTSMSGQTIEVLNTDAEGRLILCDALTYAERYKPAAVVDVATLTGACVVALGHHHAGLFAADDTLAADLLAASAEAMDPCWRMPLDEEYDEGLKSNFADMANVGSRAGGAITAAKFLQRYAKQYPWAHLDIAGVAHRSGAAKGATGRPVGLLTHFVLSRAAKR